MPGNRNRPIKKQLRSMPERAATSDVAYERELIAEARRKARRESEEKFRSLVLYIPDVIWTSDKDQRIIFFSQNVKAVTGYTPEEEYEMDQWMRWWDRIHPDDAESYIIAYKELLENKKPFNIMYRFKRKDGRWIWIHDRAIAAYEKDGMEYADGLLSDITEYKHAESEIERLKEKYESVIRNIPDALYSCLPDETASMIFISDRYKDWTGYSPQDFYKDPGLWPKTIHPKDRDRAVRTYVEAWKKKKAYLSEYRVVHKDTGQIRWIRDHGMPVTDGNGKLVLFDGLFSDITEHKEMEEKLQKSEEFSSKLLSDSPNPVVVIDSGGAIRYVNPALEKITGYPSAELLGTKLPYSWCTDETCGAGGMNLRVAMHKRVDGKEKLFRKKSGEQIWVEESTVPIVYSDGSEYLLVNWVDITEQKKLRENMQFYIREITMAQEQERKRLSRELHDETVQSLADLYTDIDEIMMKERLSENVIQRLQQLRYKVDNMLDEVHRFSYELQPGLLDEFGLIPSLELLTEEMNTGKKFSCRINTMGSERRLSFEAETILFRITQEALRNIKKHSGATEGVINVEFCDGQVRISITDNGMGFEIPDDLSSFARRGKLGMMGMQERARLVNGSLSIKSKAGKGTTITVEMPA